jgi:hypothetical protein
VFFPKVVVGSLRCSSSSLFSFVKCEVKGELCKACPFFLLLVAHVAMGSLSFSLLLSWFARTRVSYVELVVKLELFDIVVILVWGGGSYVELMVIFLVLFVVEVVLMGSGSSFSSLSPWFA